VAGLLAGLAITLLVLAGLAFGADRVAASLVQGTVEQALAIGTVAAPGAHIEGAALNIDNDFPFLPQLLRGQLREVSGALGRGDFGQFEVQDLHFHAEGVHIPALTAADLGRRLAGRPTHISLPVDHLEANALIPYLTISNAISHQFSNLTGGDIVTKADSNALVFSFELLGAEISFVTSPTVLPPNTININVDQIILGGVIITPNDLPFGLGAQIPTEFQFAPDLPSGASIDQITVQPDGLRIYLTGNNVDITRLFG